MGQTTSELYLDSIILLIGHSELTFTSFHATYTTTELWKYTVNSYKNKEFGRKDCV